MAYHLPRVVYWAQAGSAGFFPTHYFNHLTLQPLAEYLVLHTCILTGGDRLANVVQYLSWVGSIDAVALIARELGASLHGQVLAAFLAATLPNAILQATGVKNELVLSMWLAAMVYFALRREWVFCSLGLALALLTKATAYLFAPPLLNATAGRDLLRPRVAAAFGAAVLLINGPHFWRNFELSRSPLGYDSAHGDRVPLA